MVKASGQIEQELALLQTQTEQMAEALEPLYEGYLKALSEAGKQQLMMAAYHLCTQAYPDNFLALSWDQRHRLQQALQAIAGQIYQQLIVQRSQAQKMSRRPQQQQGLAFLQRLLAARSAGSGMAAKALDLQDLSDLEAGEELGDGRSPSTQPNAASADLTAQDLTAEDFSNEELVDEVFSAEALRADSYDDDEAFDSIDFEDDGLAEKAPADEDDVDFEMDVPAADQRLTLTEEEDLLAALEGLARRSLQTQETGESTPNEIDQPLAPIHLMKQQVLLERAIQDVFSAISEEANTLLQKAEVMPSFPKALLAAATDPRGLGEPVNAVPNVVKVSVRVMHGESLIDADEEDALSDRELGDIDSEDMVSNDNPRTESPDQLPEEFRPRRDQRRRRESNSKRLDRISSRRDSSRRRTDRSAASMRQVVPRQIQEIDALPDLAAISMRLSEVEFTDAAVSAWRSRLRQKLSDLKKLAGRYKKAQKALETAQAEDAWRASWTVRQEDDLT